MNENVPLGGTALEGGTTVADRVCDVLLLFTQGSTELGVSEIARRLELPKSVVHRILRSLSSRELIRHTRDGRSYQLGPAAALLGARAWAALDVHAAARPVLRRLRDETGETTTLSQLVGAERTYVEQFESRREVKMTVALGVRHSLHAGASGKAMLAHLDPAEQERVLAVPLRSLTPAPVTDTDLLRTELAEIARRGSAISLGERLPEAGAIAAPILLPTGEVFGAISLCGPLGRFDPDTVRRYEPMVRAAATEICRALAEPHTIQDQEL
ncbi:IclR family transcriptional regulator [Streptomyces sp. TM32]|uniref:IclR family transcriptional regulator n=1 Tax=Streptomyces sp. TM32 TaxID=1652669 RepID=UPI001012E88D|nr:IclR family transcriptional regulator [Streptomyces sp. TM32]RXS88395.1 IclR family transcriptional regulator [Streptomyces sp. TM32]